MQAFTTEQAIAAFAAADRDQVVLPDLKSVEWDNLDYLGWRQEGTQKGFLLTYADDQLVGMVLRFTNRQPERRTGMCQLCLSVDHQGDVGMTMIDSWYQPRTSIGIHLCRDLDCSLKARGIRQADTMHETISHGQRVERLQMRLNDFAVRMSRKP